MTQAEITQGSIFTMISKLAIVFFQQQKKRGNERKKEKKKERNVRGINQERNGDLKRKKWPKKGYLYNNKQKC